MANLVSPGISVSVTDESFYVGAGQGTVPLIFISTRENKPTPDGSSIAPGTRPENANKLYLISSQRELIQTFGLPEFKSVAGAQRNGSPLNEYGLLAAHSYLGISNRAYVIRSDINLSELEASAIEPAADPEDLTYWTPLGLISTGLFKSADGVWEPVAVKVFEGIITAGSQLPSSGFVNDDIVLAANNQGEFEFFEKSTSVWQKLAVDHVEPHFNVPTPSADDEYWFKTTTPNRGANIPVRVFDGEINRFVDAGVVRFAEDADTFYNEFFGGDGRNVPAGTLAALYDHDTGGSNALTFSLFWHNGASETRVVGEDFDVTLATDLSLVFNGNPVTIPVTISNNERSPFDFVGRTQEDATAITLTGSEGTRTFAGAGLTLTVQVTDNSSTLNFEITDVSGTFDGSGSTIVFEDTAMSSSDQFTMALNYDLDLIVAAINTAGIDNVVASREGNRLVLTNEAGRDINVSGDPQLIQTGNYSNFLLISEAAPAYRASFNQPSRGPRDGVLWYNPAFDVDILIRNGNSWVELAHPPIVQPSEPTARPGGGELMDNDVWVQTLASVEYPTVYRWKATAGWVKVDNTDQTTPDGIIFADARPSPGFAANGSSVVGANNGGGSNPDLDIDRPDPKLYPKDMLLFNTRYSGRNVKRWIQDYMVKGVFVGGRWVSVSGLNADGSLITGEQAQRAAVNQALAQVILNNDDIRSESIFYNLICVPGHGELSNELTSLNIDRKETAFIIADSPFDLTPDATSLQAWAQSLTSNNENVAYYYPSGITRNLDGAEVVVPSSHMVLRTYAFNDQVSYPWFAPAGFQRGRVTNATQVGYVSSEGEFTQVSLNQGQRDVLYLNNVNPIAFAPNRGIVVFGQKTRYPLDSALDRVNVARLINYIRFQAERISEPFLFQPNDTQTRIAVKDRFESFLDELVTLRGLFDYLVVVDEQNNTPARIDRNELWVDIAISPTRAIEFIYIPIRVRNSGADLTI